MSRKLIVILVASLVFYSAQTLALGLGDIELNSGLNQPFDASIKLVSRNDAELEGLRVGLASNADFERIGAIRLPFLNGLNFEIVTPDTGKPYIKVTSTQPIREPFVDFILEANWPAGRLLREYTVLLDPPTITTERAAPVQAPTTSRAPAAAPAPAPRASAPRRQQESSSSGGGIIQPTTTATVTSTSDLVFGPVGATDTLWNIADSMRPTDDVSVQQMMIALLKENPEAFGNNNINNLKRGATLSIEDESVITELSHRQAASETSRQYQDWLAAKEARRAARGEVAKQEADAGSEAASEAVSDSVASAEEGASPEGGLRLLADDALDDGTTAGGVAEVDGVSGEIGALREELELTAFAAESAREQNAELRDRLSGLEEKIAEMQRALQLKDDTLTQLQQKLSEPTDVDVGDPAGEAAGSIETLALEPEQEAEIIEQASEAGTGDEAGAGELETVVESSSDAATEELAEMAKEPEVVAEPEPTAELEASEEAATPSMIDNVINNASDIAVSVKDKVTAFFSDFSFDSVKETLQPENILERYRENPLIFRIVSGIIAVLVILGLIVRRRRVVAEEQFEEFTSPRVDEGEADEVEEDEFGIGGVEGDMVDALNEADVYISYQRYDKAETILKHAIDNEPDRVDLKAKLLEVYHAAKDVPAFVVSVDEYADELAGDESVWSQVYEMGLELAPDHHLFSSDAEEAAEFDKVEGFDELSELDDIDDSGEDIGSDDYADIDLEMEVLTAEGDVWDESDTVADESAEPDASHDESVDLEATEEASDELVADAETLYEEASKDLEDELDLDLNLDMDDGSDNKVEAVSEAPAVADDVVGSDVEEMAFANEEAPPSEGEVSSVDDSEMAPSGNAGEETNDSVEGPSLLERAMDNVSAHPEDANFNEKFGATNVGDSIGEPMGTYNTADDAGDGGSYDPSLFAGVDVVSTKLDLAKAYIDMGDQDGARSILGEVVTEGSEEQQKEAQELIDQM